MNKSRELYHLRRFKGIYPDFPDGEIEETEAPDFVVRGENTSVGIEITEVFQPGPTHGGSLQAQDSLAQKIVKKAKELYEQTDGRPLHVQILFVPNRNIGKQNTTNIAEHIVRLVKKAPIEPGNTITLRRTRDGYKGFPNDVALIHIFYHPNATANTWYCSSAGFIARLSWEDVREIIKKKELKLEKYAPCSEVWLLIVAYDVRVPSTVELDESVTLIPHTTSFSHVFFLWSASERYVELPIGWSNALPSDNG